MRSFLCLNSPLWAAYIVLYLQTWATTDIEPPVYYAEKSVCSTLHGFIYSLEYTFFLQLFPEFGCCVMENLLLQLSVVQHQHSGQVYKSISFGQVQWFIQNENGQPRTTMVDEKKKKKSERKLEHSKLNFLRPHFQCSKMKLKQKWKFHEFFMTNTVADNDHDYMRDTLDVAGGMADIFAVSWQSAQPCLHIMTHPP